MPKLAAIYSVFSLFLFGALFAAFYVSGLGTPSEDWSAIQPVEAPSEPEGPPPDPLAEGLDYPTLTPGITYRVSHLTRLYPEPVEESPESLPARGFFVVESQVDIGKDRWYRVTVSDGARNYSRYILARDLNYKRVVAMTNNEVSREERSRIALEQFIAEARARRAARRAANPPPPPPPRTPETFNEWWSMTADRMGGATTASIVASGVASAVATALTIGSIIMVIAFRREHTWDRAQSHALEDEWDEATQDDPQEESPADTADQRW